MSQDTGLTVCVCAYMCAHMHVTIDRSFYTFFLMFTRLVLLHGIINIHKCEVSEVTKGGFPMLNTLTET